MLILSIVCFIFKKKVYGGVCMCICVGGPGREQSVPAEQPFPADSSVCSQPQHAARGPWWCQLHRGAGQQQRELQPDAQPSTVQVHLDRHTHKKKQKTCLYTDTDMLGVTVLADNIKLIEHYSTPLSMGLRLPSTYCNGFIMAGLTVILWSLLEMTDKRNYIIECSI